MSSDIRLNTPVFCRVVPDVHIMSSVTLDQSSRNFYTI